MSVHNLRAVCPVLCGRLWQRKEVLRRWVRRDAGPAWHRNSVILLAKTLALSWGHTMRGSSIHLRCSSLEPVYRYSVFMKICIHSALCKSFSKRMLPEIVYMRTNIPVMIILALGICINLNPIPVLITIFGWMPHVKHLHTFISAHVQR